MTNQITITEPVVHEIENSCAAIINDITTISTQISGVIREAQIIEINQKVASIKGETERIRSRIIGHDATVIGGAIKKIGGSVIAALFVVGVTANAAVVVHPDVSVVHGHVVPVSPPVVAVGDVVCNVAPVNGVLTPMVSVVAHEEKPYTANDWVVSHLVLDHVVHKQVNGVNSVVPSSAVVAATHVSPVMYGVCLPFPDVSQELVS